MVHWKEQIERAAEAIAQAQRVLVVSGAGVSAESGVPTFRGEGGLWRNYRAEELASLQAFQQDPRLIWEWYGWRRELVAACAPNAGHTALAQWLLERAGQAMLFTQNVDGLHALAQAEAGGGPDPIELHGNLFRIRCTLCDWRVAHRGPIDTTARETLPHCEVCGALARPDIVWFGEALDRHILQSAFGWAARADLTLVLGTSGVVHPAATLPMMTHERGGVVIEVNPAETPLSELARYRVQARAGEALPGLLLR